MHPCRLQHTARPERVGDGLSVRDRNAVPVDATEPYAAASALDKEREGRSAKAIDLERLALEERACKQVGGIAIDLARIGGEGRTGGGRTFPGLDQMVMLVHIAG